MDAVRKSVIAGSWYSGNPSTLRRDIEDYLKLVPNMELDGELVAIIAPHAGYVYSGHVAAHAYKLIIGRNYDAVIIIGPSHRAAFHGVSIFSSGGYETPLGIVPIAEDLAETIKKNCKLVSDISAAHLQEHSIEIQLPFLQYALGDFLFVPLVMGDQDALTCQDLAQAILDSIQSMKVLIVASSDLSHFHRYNEAIKLDEVAIQYLKDSDASGLLDSLKNNNTEACGGGPMAVAMIVGRMFGANKARVLKYANSGDVTGDKSSVVGYAAAIYYK
jgi:AmmeMemoRadiSam system protein B